MNRSVFDKLDKKLANFQVIQVFSFTKQTVKDRVLIVMTKPPKVVYDCKVKVGEPKDYADNLKNKVFDTECPQSKIQLPSELFKSTPMTEDLLPSP
jgi:hypothetical protein